MQYTEFSPSDIIFHFDLQIHTIYNSMRVKKGGSILELLNDQKKKEGPRSWIGFLHSYFASPIITYLEFYH
jgi:hypothetical protein